MALDHLEETVTQKEKWKSSSEVVADSDRNGSGGFDCNICLECVQDPVVTLCGHLYCWPCIYKWLHFQSTSLETEEQQKPQCPVCKSEVSQSSLVPLYGRGLTTIPSEGKPHQVGTVIPQRPQGPISFNTTRVSQPISRSYHSYNHYHHPQQFNSTPNGYTSPMLTTSGSLDNTFGIFGGMIYARVFGNQLVTSQQIRGFRIGMALLIGKDRHKCIKPAVRKSCLSISWDETSCCGPYNKMPALSFFNGFPSYDFAKLMGHFAHKRRHRKWSILYVSTLTYTKTFVTNSYQAMPMHGVAPVFQL
ncbi:E3 ubiquitin-protein ligase RMA1H1, partial [Mucuna pruriens]